MRIGLLLSRISIVLIAGALVLVHANPVAAQDGDDTSQDETADGESVDDEDEDDEDEDDEDEDEDGEKADRESSEGDEEERTILESLASSSEDDSGSDDTLTEDPSTAEAFSGTDGLTGGSADADGTSTGASIGDLGKKKKDKSSQKSKPSHKIGMSIGDVGVTGTGELPSASIKNVVRRRASAIHRCLERTLKKTPSAVPERGTFLLTIQITRRGRVSMARVLKSDLPEVTKSCVSGSAKRWRFPRPEGGSVATKVEFGFEVETTD